MTNLNIPAPPSGQRPVDTYQWLGKILEVLGTTKGISWYDNNALNIKQLGDAIGNDINFSETVDRKIADSHLPVQIPAYCDLDTYTATGLYTSDSDGNTATITNRPPGTKGFILQVYTVWGSAESNRVIQIAYMRSDAMIYTRSKDESGNNWSEWVSYIRSTDVTPNNTGNKVVQRDSSGNFSAGTITASLSGNAKTATTLQTARNINGTPFNGSGDITTSNWGTSRNITIGNSTKPVNGSTNVTWTLSEIGAANASHTHTSAQISDATNANTANMIVKRDASGNFSAGTITAALAGNASTATKLATARSINGTRFDGSGDITTANWGTSRNITIGNSTKPVNGSVNVGWSLSEIGALPLTGGTVTGPIIKSGVGAGFAISNGTSRTMMYSSQTAGEHIFGGSNNSSLEVTDYIRIGANKLSYQTGGAVYNIYHEGNKPTSEHISDATSANTANKIVKRDASGNFSAGTITASLSGNAKTATTLQTARNINGTSFNGSGDITTAKWGTARTIELSGDVTGSVSVDGSKNATIATRRRHCICGQTTTADTTNCYFKVASFSTTSNYTDARISFYVSSDYASTDGGILHALCRRGNGSSAIDLRTLVWDFAHGISANDFQLVSITSGSTTTFEIWVKVTSAHKCYRFNVIDEGNRSNSNNVWTLYDSKNTSSSTGGKSAVTSGGTVSNSTFASILNNSASATKLDTSRSINGTKFDGSGDITTANWGTSRTITIGNSGKSVNGSGNVSWSLSEIGAIPLTGSTAITGTLRNTAEFQSTSANAFRMVQGNYGTFFRNDGTHTYFMITASGDQYGSYNNLRPLMVHHSTGLVTFGNGLKGELTGNASTATTLQTARTINGTSFNGSANITTANWGTARNITIGNSTKSVNGSVNVGWTLSEIGAAASSHTHSYLPLSGGSISSSSFGPLIIERTGSTNGAGIGFKNTNGVLGYIGMTASANGGLLRFSADTNTQYTVLDTGNFKSHVTPSAIGAATSSHTHSYLPLSGGTVTGETIFNNYISLNAWSGYGSGKAQMWYNGNSKAIVFQPTTVTDIMVNNNLVYHQGRKPTPADIGAAAASHTHNYAGSSSAGGNANAAVKLATARTISLTGDATGSVSFDGSANVSLSTTTRRIAYVGSDAASSNGWYKVLSQTMSGYGNTVVTFAVTSTYGTYANGILHINMRSDSSSISCKRLTWLSRVGFEASNFIINISGMTWTLYANQPQSQYGRIMFEVISDSSINNKISGITLTSNSTKESTTPTATVTSSDAGAPILQTARTINGTSFNGTANITTANWGTARTITIGSTGKSVNGSANVSWSLSEIGAAAASHTHNYLPLSGGTVTGETIFNNYLSLNAWPNYGTGKVQLWYDGNKKEIAANNSSLNDIRVNGGYVYHQGRKPTPADIGAAASSHTHTSAQISDATNANTANMIVKRDGSGNFSAGTISASLNGTASYANYMNSNTRMEYGWNGVNYFNISGTAGNAAKVNDTPTTAWWHIMRFNHANSAGFYTDLAVPFNDMSLYYKRVTSGTVQNGGWIKVLDDKNYTSFVPTKTGSGASGTWGISVSGNASTATKLQTARTINGTSFDGSANITTSNWGTARTLTIGNSGKSVNGSANVSWTLAEIGAFGKQGEVTSSTNWNTLLTPGMYKVQMSAWGATSLGGPNNLMSGLYSYGMVFVYQSNVENETRTVQTYYPHKSDNSSPILTRMYNGTSWNSWSKIGRGLTYSDVGAAAATHTHNYAGSSSAGGNANAAVKLATARTINGTSFDGSANITTANWGTARTLTIGSTGKSVNGSGNVSWSLAEIGAAAASHTHSYLPLSGGTITGSLTTAYIKVGGNLDVNAYLTMKHNTSIRSYNADNSTLRHLVWIAPDNKTRIGDEKSSVVVSHSLESLGPISSSSTITGVDIKANNFIPVGPNLHLRGSGTNYDQGTIVLFTSPRPATNGAQTLGSTNYRFGSVWCTQGVFNGSDSKLKENIKLINKKVYTANLDNDNVTMEELYTYIKESNLYTYNFKKSTENVIGILADELPDNIFNKIGVISKTEEEYIEEVEQQKKCIELLNTPRTLNLTDEDVVEEVGITYEEFKEVINKEVEEPVRLINAPAQVAMIQGVLGMALNKLEYAENEINDLRSEVAELKALVNQLISK